MVTEKREDGRRKSARTERSRDAIPPHVIEVASHVFQRLGYEKASVADVASELGILKGSLYHYITTKSDLLRGVVREPLEEVTRQVEELAASSLPPVEKIRKLFADHVQSFVTFYPHIFVYLRDFHATEEDPTLRAISHRYVMASRAILTEARTSGVLRKDLDPELLEAALFGMCNWTFRWFDPDRHSPSLVSATFVEIFLNGALAD